MTLRFVVVGEPRPKGSLSHGRGGRAYWPKRVKEWEALVQREALKTMCRNGFPLIGVSCSVSLIFYVTPTKGGKKPGRKRGDVDKLSRTVLDAMTGAVYEDDEQVDWLHASKRPVEKGCLPRVEVAVCIMVLT